VNRSLLQLWAGLLLALSCLPLLAQTTTQDWAPLDAAVRAQIEAETMPGAVILIGDAHSIWLRRAYGWRTRSPQPEAMTTDTVFDLASLTKVIATTTAVMQLVEQGKLQLDAPVARYWPAFAAQGKDQITVAQLLAHTSGLRADLDLSKPWSGERSGLALVASERPRQPPGTHMVYSDINFIVLGELVARVSGQSLAQYTAQHILAPLDMSDTGFLPAASLRPRMAPTELPVRGVVHDPTARRMGGVTGHAGLFGTADDLARFAQALLAGPKAKQLLKPETVLAMLQPQSPMDQTPWRGLGWQLEAPLAANRELQAPVGALGHTGYTGTGLWIDFVQRRFAVILSNRVHPNGQGDARPLRRQVLALLSSIAPPVSPAQVAALDPQLSTATRPPARPQDAPAVSTGIDVLRGDGYRALQGQRVGLITNLSAIDAHGWRTLDRLRWAPGVQLAKVFTPEHGLYREQEGRIPSGLEPLSGLPLISLYGQVRQPTPDMLQGLDLLVFDMQDAGARFFTYISTMGLAMEAAARAGLPFMVLDRPNPLGADRLKGPMLDADLLSFTAYARLPVQHGMTVGELAGLFRDDIQQRLKLDVKLTVIPMRGYRRAMRFDQTGLDWVPPSPNLRTLQATLLYPGTSWVEGSNVSVGRGTDHPFAWVGAPWIDGPRLAQALNRLALLGVSITPVDFVPDAAPYRGQACHGVAWRITRADALDAPALGLALVQTLYRLWPDRFELDKTLGMIGSRQTLQALREGVEPAAIMQRWTADQQTFAKRRQQALLYPEGP
jgi:uncharacterized protein YbbC (DUF1343 family)